MPQVHGVNTVLISPDERSKHSPSNHNSRGPSNHNLPAPPQRLRRLRVIILVSEPDDDVPALNTSPNMSSVASTPASCSTSSACSRRWTKQSSSTDRDLPSAPLDLRLEQTPGSLHSRFTSRTLRRFDPRCIPHWVNTASSWGRSRRRAMRRRNRRSRTSRRSASFNEGGSVASSWIPTEPRPATASGFLHPAVTRLALSHSSRLYSASK